MVSDLNSKYKWDSSPVYGTDGTSSENKFPFMKKIGLSYSNKESKILLSAEFESSNAGTTRINNLLIFNKKLNTPAKSGIQNSKKR